MQENIILKEISQVLLPELRSLKEGCSRVCAVKGNAEAGFFGSQPVEAFKNSEVLDHLNRSCEAVLELLESRPSITAKQSEVTLNIENLIKPEETGIGLSN